MRCRYTPTELGLSYEQTQDIFVTKQEQERRRAAGRAGGRAGGFSQARARTQTLNRARCRWC